MRRNRLAANSGRGSTGMIGRRRASRGSGVTAFPLFIDATKRSPGPDQERLGGMKAPTELLGDLGNWQPVQVPQRQRGALMGGKTGKGSVGSRDDELRLPWVVHRFGAIIDHRKPATLAVRSPPVVDQLVAGDAYQPGDRELRRV